MESNSIIAKKYKNGIELHNCKNLKKMECWFYTSQSAIPMIFK
jgi:hypothetical protein